MDRILWCSQSNLCTTSPERGRKVLHRSQCRSVPHNPFQAPNSNPLHWWLKLWAFLSWQNVSYIQVVIWSMDHLWKALTAVFNSYRSFKILTGLEDWQQWTKCFLHVDGSGGRAPHVLSTLGSQVWVLQARLHLVQPQGQNQRRKWTETQRLPKVTSVLGTISL